MKKFQKPISWQFALGLGLISLSALIYYIHYLIFRDAHHIFLYLIENLAFLFLQVFLVTIVIDRILSFRDKEAMLKKMNMVIGVFFSDVGIGLLKKFSSYDPKSFEVAERVITKKGWSKKEILDIKGFLKNYPHDIEVTRDQFISLKDFLKDKRTLLLGLLQNPNLLEHESFTNLLWAVFHLLEELTQRKDLMKMSDEDHKHLIADMRRAYRFLSFEWVDYMIHLNRNYPYLFSFAIRTNPFDKHCKVEIH